MIRNKFVIFGLAALLFLGASAVMAADKAAIRSADAFLSLVDSGNYGGSWERASSFFQSKVSKQAWVDQLNNVRKPYGAVKSRKVLGAKGYNSLPNAPAGQYVVVEYATAFAKMDSGERVTMMRHADGSWRMAGYFILK